MTVGGRIYLHIDPTLILLGTKQRNILLFIEKKFPLEIRKEIMETSRLNGG